REPRPPREPRQPREPREPREARPPRDRQPAEPQRPAEAPALVAETPQPEPAQQSLPIAQPVETLPVVAMPQISLALPPDSDLVMVETRHHAAPTSEEPEAPRPKRVRPPRVEIASEPLEIVETRKETPPPAA